jgi:hypothetical protein
MGVLLSTILMITSSLIMQGTSTFEAEEPRVTINNACAFVLVLAGSSPLRKNLRPCF